jgi:acetate kinase
MPEHVYLYAIPFELYEKYKVRRFGFHGTSHKYVSARACEILGLDYNKQKIITCHLGNGSSVAAIKNGKSFDTSMGMTPAEGLIMGTRTGDLDPGALLYMAEKEDTSIKETSNLLNKKSGMLGISGVSSDMRDIEFAANNGNHRAQLALEMFAYRVKKYIGAYTAALGGVDVIVFAGGIGERDTETRKRILSGLEFLGIELDPKNLDTKGEETILTTKNSKVKVIVVPTDEEMMIAKDTFELVK